jgi:hypothetical protein
LIPADKLIWALDAVLEDQFELCEAFAEYLYRRHPQTAWHTLADRLLARLHGLKDTPRAPMISAATTNVTGSAIGPSMPWSKPAERTEIIPLCIAEARKTGSFDRLVKRLMAARRYEDAEKWIQEGLRDHRRKMARHRAGLRDKLREIRTLEQNWPAVAALQVEEFVRRPSRPAFTECQKACGKAKVWPKVRESLLCYLETGELPWSRKAGPFRNPAWTGLMRISGIDFPWSAI